MPGLAEASFAAEALIHLVREAMFEQANYPAYFYLPPFVSGQSEPGGAALS